MTQKDIYLLDTNAVSDLLKHRSQNARRAFTEARRDGSVAMSTLSQAELLYGFDQKPEAIRLRELFADLCSYVEIVPWNQDAARSYAVLRSALKTRNRTVDTIDLLIAAQAHAMDAVVVTRDADFRHLAGLVKVVDWATESKMPQGAE